MSLTTSPTTIDGSANPLIPVLMEPEEQQPGLHGRVVQ